MLTWHVSNAALTQDNSHSLHVDRPGFPFQVQEVSAAELTGVQTKLQAAAHAEQAAQHQMSQQHQLIQQLQSQLQVSHVLQAHSV